MNNQKTKPQRLKGFNDFFAKDVKLREFVINTFKNSFEKYGYEPLETPALELTQMMLGISGVEAEKMFYRFKDPGGRDVMMKYEVMTGMARAVAENINNIKFPYKRYQIQPVWRSENAQKGRYREFTQCDADTIGVYNMFYDAEFIGMGLEIVGKLGFKNYVTKISNRNFLEGLSEVVKLPKELFYEYFIAIDKLLKIGPEGVIATMQDRGISKEIAEKTVALIDPEKYDKMDFASIINGMRKTVGQTEKGKLGLDELEQINNYLQLAEIDPKLYKFDLSLARGLASYTGPVWEFEVIDGGVGSIAGAGRYDKLIEKYIGKEIPATGGSFGIERVCDIIKDRQMMDLGDTTTEYMLAVYNDEMLKPALEIARKLRDQNKKVMVYPDAIGIGKQLKYADQKGIPQVIIVAPEEIAQNKVQIKEMKSGESKLVDIKEL
ncbi:MAG: histidine--tRNA ligase [Candidatus Dojkabacteria bacterium]